MQIEGTPSSVTPSRLSRWAGTVVRVFPGAIIMLLLLHTMLAVVDPMGAHAYASDLATLNNIYIMDPTRGRVPLPGEYEAAGWTFTILEDHTRQVPGALEHECRIALVGDSATFAMGVDDAQTWANLVAPHVPARIINAGVPGYNIAEARRMIEAYPADGYVYLLINNDAHAPSACCGESSVPDAGLFFYIRWITHRQTRVLIDDLEMFDSEAAIIAARDDTITLAFDGWHLTERMPGAIIIPEYTTFVSAADRHADAAGNEVIAAGALEQIQALARRACDA